MRPRHHRQRARGRWQQPALWAQQPSSWIAQRAGRLPVDVQMKAEQISRKAEALMQYADRFPTGSQDLYVLQRTPEKYLPNTLDAYLAVHPGYAHAPISPDGKTALQALWEQLNLLDSKLDEIAYSLNRHNLDRLVANGRFLEECFGRHETELAGVAIRSAGGQRGAGPGPSSARGAAQAQPSGPAGSGRKPSSRSAGRPPAVSSSSAPCRCSLRSFAPSPASAARRAALRLSSLKSAG